MSAKNYLETSVRPITPNLHKTTSLSSLKVKGVGGVTPPRSPALLRVSSNLSTTSYSLMPSRSPLPTPIEESSPVPLVTAASVAKVFFQHELEALHGSIGNKAVNTVVILHDACYGHRYARPRTSKFSLNTIVERPERIQATVLGISAAYVRLGERCVEGKNAPNPKNTVAPHQTIPFRIMKSCRFVSLVSPATIQVHGAKWMAELKMMCGDAEAKLALNGKELTRPGNQSDSSDEIKPKLHEGDLYLCSESLTALEGALGGVCEAVDIVFQDTGPKRAFISVRPPGHHCSASYPSGFCWINNIHVGISYASITHGLTHAAIIDFDLHHGDGSQAITWDHNAKVATLPKNAANSKKTAIGYFSLHDINSYPCEYGDEEKVRNASLCIENAHGQTIWNVHLQPWRGDSEFWELYESRYAILLSKSRAFLKQHSERLRLSNTIKPKAAIFLSAGFDASEWESPGMQRHKVNVPTDFYARFTKDIVDLANEPDLGVDGRVISVLEGGYSDRALTSGVFSHLCGLSGSKGTETQTELANGLGLEMRRRLDKEDNTDPSRTLQATRVDPEWWSLPKLEELEHQVSLPHSSAPPEKPRTGVTPTYYSPTQSFTAKIVSSPTGRRSTSDSMLNQKMPSSVCERPLSPPAPDVEWTIAAHELSKLLIPTNRQTKSCKPEDLSVEATRVRRNRQSMIGVRVDTIIDDTKRMNLRERKAKVPVSKVNEEDSRPTSRVSRRKTIAGAASLMKEDEDQLNLSQLQTGMEKVASRRRLSIASTAISSADDGASKTTSNRTDRGGLMALQRRRSSSTLSTRPDSSMSNLPLFKKTRTPVKSRLPSKTRVVKKPVELPLIDFAPVEHSNTTVVDNNGRPSPAQTLIQPPPPLTSKHASQHDLDKLASGMKKMSIKLNITPKEEQGSRESKRIPTSRAPRKSTAAKPGKKQTAKLSISEASSSVIHHPVRVEPSPLELELVLPTTTPAKSLMISTTNATPSPPPPEPSMGTTSKGLPASFDEPLSASILFPTAGVQAPALDPVNHMSNEAPQEKPICPPKPINEPLYVASAPAPTLFVPWPSTPKYAQRNLPVFTSTSSIVFGLPDHYAPGMAQEFQAARQLDYPQNVAAEQQQTEIESPADVQQGHASAITQPPVDIRGVPDKLRQRMS